MGTEVTHEVKCCGTCLWHLHEDISDGWVCVNASSERCADWTDDDYFCSVWERRSEE